MADLLRTVWAQKIGALLFSRESLLFDLLEELYPELLQEDRLTAEGLSIDVERLEESSERAEVLTGWAHAFDFSDPLADTCLAGRLEEGIPAD